MDGRRRALVLVAAGIALIGGTLVVSAATAPDRVTDDGEHRQTLVGSQGGGAGWHEYGSVFLLNGSEQTWTEDSAGSYFDVTMLPNGSVMAGFMNTGVRGCGPYDSPCARTGFRIVDPDADGGPTVVSEYSFPVRSASNSEVHDVEHLESGEYLMTGMDTERVFTIRGGEVTWQWNASSFYNPPEDPTRRDWLHINDVDAINQSHYLVSVRNANQLLVIERGAGVAEVINSDVERSSDDSCLVRGSQLVPDESGDPVRCGNPDVLNHQHNPQWLGDGAVLVADSDNDRVVELHRTEDGHWEPAWVLDHAGDIALNWPRDADRLDNGNTLVTDTLNKRIFEVRENGSVVWSTTTEYIPYEAERLSEGERTSGAKYAVDDSVESPNESVPVLSSGLTVLRAGFPWLPFWFTETQLGISMLGVALIAGGGIDRWRTR